MMSGPAAEHQVPVGGGSPTQEPGVWVGIDTHTETHHVAVIDAAGRAVEDRAVRADARGYRQVLACLERWAPVCGVGVECTGSYGAEVTRVLTGAGYAVVEVDRPDAYTRRRRGKDDALDAYAAAAAAMTGQASAQPKARDGLVEALRVLRTTRESAVRDRTATINQLKGMLIAAPESVRATYRQMSTTTLVTALTATRPPAEPGTALEATRYALRLLARRYQHLSEQIHDLSTQLTRLLREHVPALMEVYCAGPDTISQLLITAGDNADRLRSAAHFAALTGAAPIPASSGKTTRYRLNRGGDRKANCALHRIILVRMRHDEQTRAYVARRTAEGKTKREIMRCLKRYLARQLYPLIIQALKDPTTQPAT